MSNPKLIRKLVERNPDLNLKDSAEILNIFTKCIHQSLLDNRNIELRGFGSFFVKKLKEKHSARNPKTGELIYVPEKNKVRFRASKKLKDFINKWNNLKYLSPVIRQV